MFIREALMVSGTPLNTGYNSALISIANVTPQIT